MQYFFQQRIMYFLLFQDPQIFPDPHYFKLKTLENLWFSDIFRGYRKRPVA